MRACPPMVVRNALHCFSAIMYAFLTRFSRAKLRFAQKFFFLILFLFGKRKRMDAAYAAGRVIVTTQPPPEALPISNSPLWRRMISSHTARPMPLPRTLEEPL